MAPSVDKPKVSVEAMVATLDSLLIGYEITGGPSGHVNRLYAARDYILASAKEIAAKDAKITRLRNGVERIVRRMRYVGLGTDAANLAAAVQEDLNELLALDPKAAAEMGCDA